MMPGNREVPQNLQFQGSQSRALRASKETHDPDLKAVAIKLIGDQVNLKSYNVSFSHRKIQELVTNIINLSAEQHTTHKCA